MEQTLRNRLETLVNVDDDVDVNGVWENIGMAVKISATERTLRVKASRITV